ncbi:PAS sensor protein [Desulfurispirillum indicum S5]|uniref:histidine kinase n=1 Tax=Desulfurispirillum indicum (strain ATCC BAA-1389 / DSM 22839 / S5) TaxID=653733 RepID=E6W7A5_DESIS|nr:PAS sensor protein [Desulfurispirillum indicum S5]
MKLLIVFFIVALWFPAQATETEETPTFGYEMFQRHGAIMLLIDPVSGAILDANQAAEDFYGYTSEELRSFHIQDLNMLSSVEVESERQAAAAEERNFFVFPHRLASGEVRTVEVYSWPVEHSGRIVLFSIIQDITEELQAREELHMYQQHLEQTVEQRTSELRTRTGWFVTALSGALLVQFIIIFALLKVIVSRKKLMEELRQSQEYNRVLFRHSRIPLIVMDAEDFHYTDCNDAAVAIYGMSNRQELLGSTPADVSAATQEDGSDSATLAVEKIQHALKEGNARFEWWHQRADGNQWLADVHLMRFEHAGRRMLQFSLIDITERKQAQQELQATLASLQQQIDDAVTRSRQQDRIIYEQSRRQSMSRLLLNLAHQWRQPLNVAGLLIQEIEECFLAEDVDHKHIRQSIAQAMEQLVDLSGTISSLTHLYETQGEVVAVHLAAIFRQSLGYLTQEQRGMLCLEQDICPHITLQAVQSDVVEIFVELLANAISIARARKRSQVAVAMTVVTTDDGAVQIVCRDNAGGIDQEILPMLFVPYTTSQFRKRDKGMGLYYLRRMVEDSYCGSLEAENRGQGACFIVRLYDHISREGESCP